MGCIIDNKDFGVQWRVFRGYCCVSFSIGTDHVCLPYAYPQHIHCLINDDFTCHFSINCMDSVTMLTLFICGYDIKLYTAYINTHACTLVLCGQTLFLPRGIIAISISAPHKKGSGRVYKVDSVFTHTNVLFVLV